MSLTGDNDERDGSSKPDWVARTFKLSRKTRIIIAATTGAFVVVVFVLLVIAAAASA